MNASREKKIGDYNIEEFYWTGKYVVYVNNRLSPLSFEEACKAYQAMKGESK